MRDSLVQHDAFDRRAYAEVSRGSARLQTLAAAGEKLVPHFDALLFDLFATLFKLNTKLISEAATPESARLRRRLLVGLSSAPGFAALRESAALDEFRAAMGAAAVAETLLRTLRRGELLEPEDLARARALAEREEELRELRESMKSVRELGREQSPVADELERESDLIGDEISELAEENKRAIDELPPAFDTTLELQAERLRGELERAEEELEAWGAGIGAPARMSATERLELGERLVHSPNLRRLAALVGAMRQFALAARRSRFEAASDEVHDVRATRELSRLLPSELSHLSHPLRRLDFLRRFTEGQALGYELRGKDERGRGPVVVCLDGSSSMAGDKELWSKAVALTLLELARRQGRAFRALYFSSREAPLRTFELLAQEKRYRRAAGRETAPLPQVLALAEHFPGGGTDFEKPLDAALAALSESHFQRGDIVLITDGECEVGAPFRERFLAEKQRLEAQLYAVLVDVGSHSASSLEPLADHLTTVTRLESAPLRELFRRV